MIYLVVYGGLVVLGGAVAAVVSLWLSRRPREHGTVIRNPSQKVRTPPAVRRARAPQRRARIAHKRGRRRFR